MEPFRSAHIQDIDAILRLQRQYYEEEHYPFDADISRQTLSALIETEHYGHLWVACDHQSVIGYLAVTLGFSLEFRGCDAFLDELYIDTDYRRRGLGRTAIQIAEAYCRDNNVKALHLEVESHRDPARSLYESAGFRNHHRHLYSKLLDTF